MTKLFWILIALLLLQKVNLYAQTPVNFQTTIEDGLPSNEVYSIIQDEKGFIWIGCDAGIYKYNSVKFQSFKNKVQKTKALTGLTLSKSGNIYAYSFNGQIFYIENDSLKHLTKWEGKISNIVCDNNHNLWVCGDHGISVYNELTHQWTQYSDFNLDHKKDQYTFTHSCKLTKENAISFISPNGITTINKQQQTLIPFEFLNPKPSGEFILESKNESAWLISVTDGLCYNLIDNNFQPYESLFLKNALSNSKVTNVKLLQDGNLWICTYSGIICYNPKLGTGKVFYSNMAFSDVIFDTEQNYWMTTLHDGILRLADIDSKTWNTSSGNLTSNKILKTEQHIPYLYFSTLGGQVGSINLTTEKIETYSLEVKSNIQNITYCENDKKLYFNAQNTLYFLENNAVKKIENQFPPIKDFLKTNDEYIIATSRGAFVYKNINDKYASDTLTTHWARTIAINSSKEILWIATNEGLESYSKKQNKWQSNHLNLIKKQVLSMAYDEQNTLYAVTFDGEIYKIDTNNVITLIQRLPADIQANQIKKYQNQLLIATNLGLWKLNLKTNNWEVLDKLKGLCSNEVLSLSIINNNIWVATPNGLQMIPVHLQKEIKQATIYLKEISIDGEETNKNNSLQLNYNQALRIKVEANAYSSNRNFKYAYRFSNADTSWILLPSSIEHIQIPSLPTGDFNLEIKIIDYLSRDSQNKIIIKGYVNPPFWQRWWFYILISLIGLSIAFVFFKYRIKLLQTKQIEELKRIQLENDLRFSQETALKAQMNPHFLFNVLNSIKGYIYENDKKNATFYLSSFSDLVRKILNHSNSSEIKLEEEIDILKLYIELEAMLIQNDFNYNISIDQDIDISNVKIPALLIQPYIENAFKHGLRHKTGKKELNMHFELPSNKNYLVISITDNGIGRAASNQLNAQHNSTHQSFATDATSKRIALLNSNNKDVVNVKIIDNLTKDHLPQGTTVVLTISLNDK